MEMSKDKSEEKPRDLWIFTDETKYQVKQFTLLLVIIFII
jgi:hypothetical protein